MSEEDLQRLFADVDAAKSSGDVEATVQLLRSALDNPELDSMFFRGSVVDELADVYATSGRFAEAHAVIREAEQAGWLKAEYAAMRNAGLLLDAGHVAMGAARYAALRPHTLDDVDLMFEAGVQLADAGLHAPAVEWLADGVRLALAHDDVEGLLEEVLEARLASLEALDRSLDDVQRDGIVHLRRHARYQQPEQQQVQPAVAYFPASEHEKARQVWPDLAEILGEGFADYVPLVERQLREVARAGLRPVLAPLVIDDYLEWARVREMDAGAANTRAAYAVELMNDGQGAGWPPSRNAPCWCGSATKYKKCCGAST